MTKPDKTFKLPRFLQRFILPLVHSDPESRQDLIRQLQSARKRHLMDGEALSMMEGVLQVSELRVRDIMIPRARMVVVERDKPLAEVLPVIIESAHSRFPVIGDDRSEVVGILLAKDLLQYCGSDARMFNMREVLRSAVFVPESKRLNILLKEFRVSRNHMAIVVDEYDFDEGAYILKRGKDLYTAKAHTTIEDFNEFFGTGFDDNAYDTIGGLVINALGHLPQRGEFVQIGDFRFTVVRSDSRKIRLLNIQRLPDTMDAGPDS